MESMPTLVRHPGIFVTAAAFLAAVISIGVLGGVAGLFQSRGEPMAQLAAAERACSQETYVSDRENCMRKVLAVAQGEHVANR